MGMDQREEGGSRGWELGELPTTKFVCYHAHINIQDASGQGPHPTLNSFAKQFMYILLRKLRLQT